MPKLVMRGVPTDDFPDVEYMSEDGNTVSRERLFSDFMSLQVQELLYHDCRDIRTMTQNTSLVSSLNY
jgi:hypothetical protein